MEINIGLRLKGEAVHNKAGGGTKLEMFLSYRKPCDILYEASEANFFFEKLFEPFAKQRSGHDLACQEERQSKPRYLKWQFYPLLHSNPPLHLNFDS